MWDILDEGSNKELFMLRNGNVYYLSDKPQDEQENAVRVIKGKINSYNILLLCLDKAVNMGTMGILEGEKISLAFDYAMDNILPIISIVASGGVRVNEGTTALMQMVKTAAAAKKNSDNGMLHIAVITNPTLGGVSASFISLADIIIAEPGVIFGFTGKRIIQETTHEELPDDFQTAEYAKRHGMVDIIADMKDIKYTLAELLRFHRKICTNKDKINDVQFRNIKS